jgi:cell division protein FtsI/penicillin-binding protein 2
MKRNGATSVTIVVMDPKTGELLAMASTPNLNLNEYWKYGEIFPDPTPYNRAVGQTYEPGSVFKVLTMAAAIDAGAVTPDTPFLDTGEVLIGGYTIYNWDRNAWGPQTMTTCMQHSLNVCLTWVAQQLGPTRFYQYLQAFGIGRKTNIDLAGEVNFPLALPGDGNWYPINLGTNSFGQGVAATPLQMITAVSALANDGKMMAPHILQSVIENGRQYNNTPQVIGNPISAKSARSITTLLAKSLEEEASDSLVDGYRVAGKTGTAEIPGPNGYVSNLTNASFVGWGPVDDPRFVVYVWLEKPKSSPWGSIVAAPVFSQVVQSLVVSMKIPPDTIRHGLALK